MRRARIKRHYIRKEVKNFHIKSALAYTEENVLVYNIFVYNIQKKATQDETMAYFSKFGKINKVRLVVRKTAPAVAFIHFDDAAAAAKVLKQTTPHTLKSKRIYVRACDSWHQPHKLLTNNDADITDAMSSANGKTFNITMLNDDCLEQIVKKLELKSQVRFSLTCKRFKNVFEMVCKTEHKNHILHNLDPLTLWEKRTFFIAAGPNIESLIGSVPEKDFARIIEFIRKFCPNIKSINFRGSKLKPAVLIKLFEKLKHCSVVELRHCSLNDHAILALKKLPNLESLSVAENIELTGKHMERLTTVKTLNLSGCNIQPTHFVEICKSLKDLHSFDIPLYEQILFDDCLHEIAQLKNLEEIVLTNCHLDNEGFLQLIRSCTTLKKVHIKFCWGLTDQFVFKVIEVLNATQNQRGKQPCVFKVFRSGISSNIINHADYLAATSLMKLNFDDDYDNGEDDIDEFFW